MECSHPAMIVTKSVLIERDADLLAAMADESLASVSISVATLNNELARRMEPRAAGPRQRLAAMERLSRRGIPVCVLVAPVIPGLTDHEIEAVLRSARDAGARGPNTYSCGSHWRSRACSTNGSTRSTRFAPARSDRSFARRPAGATIAAGSEPECAAPATSPISSRTVSSNAAGGWDSAACPSSIPAGSTLLRSGRTRRSGQENPHGRRRRRGSSGCRSEPKPGRVRTSSA